MSKQSYFGVLLVGAGVVFGGVLSFAIFNSSYRTARLASLFQEPGRLNGVDPMTWLLAVIPVALIALGTAVVVVARRKRFGDAQ